MAPCLAAQPDRAMPAKGRAQQSDARRLAAERSPEGRGAQGSARPPPRTRTPRSAQGWPGRASGRGRPGPQATPRSTSTGPIGSDRRPPPSPQPKRNSAWVVRPRVVRPRGGCSPLDGSEVDVGRQVLSPDRDERIVMGTVAGVRSERPAGAPRAVQLGRRMAVVDDEDAALLKASADLPDPVVDARADLRASAFRELDPLRHQPIPSVGVESDPVTSTNPPPSHPTKISRSSPARRSSRWTGSASRNSLAITAPTKAASGGRSSSSVEPIRNRELPHQVPSAGAR